MVNKSDTKRGKKVVKTISLDVEVAEYVDSVAERENRSLSNYLETLWKKEMELESAQKQEELA